MAERGSGGGASLCGGSVKGTWMEGSLAGVPGGWVERALKTSICFRRALLGNLEGGPSIGDFEIWMEALEMERLSLKRLSVEGFCTGDPKRYVKAL
jgi:hypothetical protein